jgi:NADH-quinone oxidoreductase subunit E
MIIANRSPLIGNGVWKNVWKIPLRETLDRRGRNRAALLPSLEIVQETAGYIPPEAVRYLKDALQVPAADIYSVASFYGMLTTRQQGEYVIRVCNSLVCNVNDSPQMIKLVEKELGIHQGETTPDHQFTLEAVACLGLCDISPGMMVNDKIYGHLNEESLREIFSNLKGTG